MRSLVQLAETREAAAKSEIAALLESRAAMFEKTEGGKESGAPSLEQKARIEAAEQRVHSTRLKFERLRMVAIGAEQGLKSLMDRLMVSLGELSPDVLRGPQGHPKGTGGHSKGHHGAGGGGGAAAATKGGMPSARRPSYMQVTPERANARVSAAAVNAQAGRGTTPKGGDRSPSPSLFPGATAPSPTAPPPGGEASSSSPRTAPEPIPEASREGTPTASTPVPEPSAPTIDPSAFTEGGEGAPTAEPSGAPAASQAEGAEGGEEEGEGQESKEGGEGEEGPEAEPSMLGGPTLALPDEPPTPSEQPGGEVPLPPPSPLPMAIPPAPKDNSTIDDEHFFPQLPDMLTSVGARLERVMQVRAWVRGPPRAALLTQRSSVLCMCCFLPVLSCLWLLPLLLCCILLSSNLTYRLTNSHTPAGHRPSGGCRRHHGSCHRNRGPVRL